MYNTDGNESCKKIDKIKPTMLHTLFGVSVILFASNTWAVSTSNSNAMAELSNLNISLTTLSGTPVINWYAKNQNADSSAQDSMAENRNSSRSSDWQSHIETPASTTFTSANANNGTRFISTFANSYSDPDAKDYLTYGSDSQFSREGYFSISGGDAIVTFTADAEIAGSVNMMNNSFNAGNVFATANLSLVRNEFNASASSYDSIQDSLYFTSDFNTSTKLYTSLRFGDGQEGMLNAAVSATASLFVSPIPIPAAAWLFGSAIIGMAAFIRRRPKELLVASS